MIDMFVKLLSLPDISAKENDLFEQGIIIRRPIPPEKDIIRTWTSKNFSSYWANEIDAAFSHLPVRTYIAQKENDLVGFACYETTNKNFFGPTGTIEAFRNKGIGEVLLVKSLTALREMGYSYAIIGGVGPIEYYKNKVNATVIPDSERSIYNHLLK